MPRGSGTCYLDNFHFKYYLFYFNLLYIYAVALFKAICYGFLNYCFGILDEIKCNFNWNLLTSLSCILVFLYHKLCVLKLARCLVIISSWKISL